MRSSSAMADALAISASAAAKSPASSWMIWARKWPWYSSERSPSSSARRTTSAHSPRRSASGLAALPLGLAEGEEELHAEDVVRLLETPEKIECPPEVVGGLLVGELCERPLTSPRRIADGLLGRGTAPRLHEVVGDLGHVGVTVPGIERLERLAGTGVQAHATGRAQAHV